MRKKKTCTLLFLFFLACILAGPELGQPARAAVLTQVQVSPAKATMRVEERRIFNFTVVNVQNLYGVDLAIQYDPRYLAAVDMDKTVPGIQGVQGPFLDSGFVVLNTVDNRTGELRYVMTQLNPSAAKNGDGVLFTFKLRARRPVQATRILPLKITLADRDGNPIAAEAIPGRISIRSRERESKLPYLP
jgi:hypothetical protein